MPLKIEVQTNYNEHELTIESCSQIIDMLQQTYMNLRKEMYNHFLGFRTSQKSNNVRHYFSFSLCTHK